MVKDRFKMVILCMILVLALPVVAQSACIQPPSGMIGWWAGDGNANDYMGANTGYTMNGATFGGGKVGQAFSLDGIDDYIRIPYNSSLNPSVITVDAWFYVSDITALHYPAIVKSVGTNSGFALEIDGDTSLLKFWVNVAGTWYESAAVAVTVDTWYHAAGTYDGSDIKIYVNGVLQGAPTHIVGSINPSTGDLNIGHDPDINVTNRFFKGLIDEVEIFNRALSASEIAAIYNAGSEGKCKKPLFSCIPVSGNPPSIDGTLSLNEWPSFAELTLNTPDYPIQTNVYCMNDSVNLYFLVDAVGDTTDDDVNSPCTSQNYSHCDECLLVFGDPNQTTNYLAEVWGKAGNVIGTNQSFPANAQVAIGFNGHRFYEWKIPLSSINATAVQNIAFSSPRLCKGAGGEEYCLSMPYDGATGRDNEWPLGVDPNNRDRWAQMQLGERISVPTFTDFGIIIFMLLAGLVSAYYLRRKQRAN